MSNLYNSSAGVLSTDDPTSDAMQIAAERGPWEEAEDFLFGEGMCAEEDILWGCCPKCHWYDRSLYLRDDPEDLKWVEDALRKRHQGECPGCDGELEFG